MPGVRVLRVYESKRRSRGDGVRILVDRLWPRGISKASLELDRWEKDVAPSNELRTWYGHRPDRFAEFKRRYDRELARPVASESVEHLKRASRTRRLTLLTATKDVERSAAAVLAERLDR